MITKENNKERICSFYASDFHLEMIILPYINKEIERNKRVFVVTEENLEDSIRILMSKINLDENRKRKILDLNWSNNYIKIIESIKEKIKNNEEICVIVNGKEKFVEEINDIIEQENGESSITIIDCYKIDDIKKHMQDVIIKHSRILNTSGIQKI